MISDFVIVEILSALVPRLTNATVQPDSDRTKMRSIAGLRGSNQCLSAPALEAFVAHPGFPRGLGPYSSTQKMGSLDVPLRIAHGHVLSRDLAVQETRLGGDGPAVAGIDVADLVADVAFVIYRRNFQAHSSR